jgi:hypothetical protein
MMVRAPFRGLAASTLVLASLVAFSGRASSGTGEFEILKRIEGTPPAGAGFSVTLSCQGVTIQPNNSSEAVVTFTASPSEQAAIGFRFEGSGTCTVTETANGGATSVTYECGQTAGGPGEGGPPPCAATGPQTSPAVLNITTPRNPSSVVITNRFAVRAQPDFTG